MPSKPSSSHPPTRKVSGDSQRAVKHRRTRSSQAAFSSISQPVQYLYSPFPPFTIGETSSEPKGPGMMPPPPPTQVNPEAEHHPTPSTYPGTTHMYQNFAVQTPYQCHPREPCSCQDCNDAALAPNASGLEIPPSSSSSPPEFPPSDTPIEDSGAKESASIQQGTDLLLELLAKEKQCIASIYEDRLARIVEKTQCEVQQMTAKHEAEKTAWEQERTQWQEARQRFEAQVKDLEAERQRWQEEYDRLENMTNYQLRVSEVNEEMPELMPQWKDEKEKFQIEADEWKDKYRQLYALWEGKEAYWKEFHAAVDRAGCIFSDGQLKRRKSAPMGLYLQTDFNA